MCADFFAGDPPPLKARAAGDQDTFLAWIKKNGPEKVLPNADKVRQLLITSWIAGKLPEADVCKLSIMNKNGMMSFFSATCKWSFDELLLWSFLQEHLLAEFPVHACTLLSLFKKGFIVQQIPQWS